MTAGREIVEEKVHF